MTELTPWAGHRILLMRGIRIIPAMTAISVRERGLGTETGVRKFEP
jgi:hypothetical protein